VRPSGTPSRNPRCSTRRSGSASFLPSYPTTGAPRELWYEDSPNKTPGPSRIRRASFTDATHVSEQDEEVSLGAAATESDGRPVLSADGLTLYFASERAAHGGHGGLDIWVATRASDKDPFGPGSLVEELATPGADYPGFLSTDGCRLYFRRPSAILVATRGK
jgi:hypothetical protein